MAMKAITILLIMFSLIPGCSQRESPRNTYDRYVQLEISGITVDQFISSYSHRKQLEIEASVVTVMEKNRLNRIQAIEKLLPMFQSFAKCKKLEFLDEEIDGDSAIIYYKSTDDCVKGQVNIKKEIIYMMYENGWKIDDNDIQEL